MRPVSFKDFTGRERLVTWHLIFTDVERRHWWDRFLMPGFRHCYAMRWDGYNWLIVNPRTDYLQVDISPYTEREAQAFAIGAATVVVSATALLPLRRLRSRWFVGPVTCVEFCKALLGIRSFWTLTPWQLFNYVRAHHGTIQKAKTTAAYGRAGSGEPALETGIERPDGRGKPSLEGAET